MNNPSIAPEIALQRTIDVRTSGFDLYRRSRRNRAPNLLDFLVRYGDAPFRPVELAVRRTVVGIPRRKPVNHDVATGRHAELICPLQMSRVGIRHVQSHMVLALRVLEVDPVDTFRGASVAPLDLVADGLLAERDLIHPHREAGLKEGPVSYTHLRAHETPEHLVCRLLLE